MFTMMFTIEQLFAIFLFGILLALIGYTGLVYCLFKGKFKTKKNKS